MATQRCKGNRRINEKLMNPINPGKQSSIHNVEEIEPPLRTILTEKYAASRERTPLTSA